MEIVLTGGEKDMRRRNMMLPIIASIGVGTAAYLSMRGKRGMANPMEKMTKAMNQPH